MLCIINATRRATAAALLSKRYKFRNVYMMAYNMLCVDVYEMYLYISNMSYRSLT